MEALYLLFPPKPKFTEKNVPDLAGKARLESAFTIST